MTSTAILIPTTAGLRRVCSARFREELPLSQIRLDGSFTPFPQSQAAHLLVTGPLRGLSPAGHSFDLAIDGEIEDGRSWELGFATAWGLAHFWPDLLTGDMEQAQRLIWVTGAIDMDLAPQAASYFLASKLALSAGLFEAAACKGQELWIIAPPGLGADDEAALAALADQAANQTQLRVLRPQHLRAVLDALGPQAPTPTTPTTPAPNTPDTPDTPAVTTTEAARDTTTGAKQALALETAGSSRAPTRLVWAAGALVLALVAGLVAWRLLPSAEAPQLRLIAHHVSLEDKTCADVIFGQAQVAPGQAQSLESGTALSVLAQGLCQLELINPSSQALAIQLPTALSRLALHDLYRNEAKIDMPAGARLTISLSAFPPRQKVVMMANSDAGKQGQFIIDFQ